MHDLVIIGGGPAALSAALYGARLGLKLVVYERNAFGGALTKIARISNFPGFDGPGTALSEKIKGQAAQSGAGFTYGECTDIKYNGEGYVLTIDGEEVLGRAVLIATGSEPRPLGIKVNVPVSYCALCDADLVRGKKVAVVGGGNSAVQESLVLAQIVKKLTLVVRSKLRASKYLQNNIRQVSNVDILEHTSPSADLLDTFEHVFVFIGHQPATSCLGLLSSQDDMLDNDGYIITGISDQFPHMTASSGVFAAGDVRSGSVRQAVTAAADGVEAVIEVARYLHLS